ncbi:hypothetical protein OG788_17670 [Streptomyces sp. NBC_00647]|uniref:hypothetical protein n=1 Tax=Streptomyces sp. NBC_00647 TaxID=2975796 RepID=UPI003251CF6E
MSEATDEQDDAYSTAVLSRLLRQALQNDPELREELASVLSAASTVTITASGERSIAAQHIGTAITDDGHTPPRV